MIMLRSVPNPMTSSLEEKLEHGDAGQGPVQMEAERAGAMQPRVKGCQELLAARKPEERPSTASRMAQCCMQHFVSPGLQSCANQLQLF